MVDRRAFTGAWIETMTLSQIESMMVVAPSRARGLKLSLSVEDVLCIMSRLHGRVD